MAKGKGRICPLCKRQTLHQEDNVSVCSNTDCGFVGWRITDEVINVGGGKGMRCPNCSHHTLKGVYEMVNQKWVYRCTICSYSGIG